ncbi:MAG: hypothetical protein Q9207_003645 [Kuettlingeria erythrocarpa]
MLSGQIIMAPFDYLMERPGKSFRTQVLAVFNVWLQVDDVSFNVIDRVVGMLHNVSLLIDDIQDGSKLRRGFPSAHIVFGVAQTINSANYVYFLAQGELLALGDSAQAAFRIFNEELLVNLHHGQGMELFRRDTLTVPSESEYYQMISNKTDGLFRLAARLLQCVSCTTYTHNIKSLADIMAAEKGYCEDMTGGKFSFPVIHALNESSPCNNELLQILKMHTDDRDMKDHAVSDMQSVTHSFDYTRAALRKLQQQAQMTIKSIQLENELIDRVMTALEVE